jgi:hypothetical protein
MGIITNNRMLMGFLVGVAVTFGVIDTSVYFAMSDSTECVNTVPPNVWVGCYIYKQSAVSRQVVNFVNPVKELTDMYVTERFVNFAYQLQDIMRSFKGGPNQPNSGGMEI